MVNGAKGAGQGATPGKSRQGKVQEQVPVSRSRSGEGEIRDMETSVVHNILADGALDEILNSPLGKELGNSPFRRIFK